MALKMSMSEQLGFFETLFGKTDPVTLAVKNMVDTGTVIELGLFVVKLTISGKVSTQTLPVGTTSIKNGTITPTAKNQCRVILRKFIEGVLNISLHPGFVVGVDHSSWPDQTAVTKHTASGSSTVFKVPESQAPAPAKTPASVAPGQVCKLSKAQSLGQKVLGTSAQSIYRVIAINHRVKIATQIKYPNVSLRVETLGATEEEMEAIKKCFDWKGDYGSKHLMCSNTVPPQRVVGAILFSLPIAWDQVVMGFNGLGEANA
jgi:hypothetical protein